MRVSADLTNQLSAYLRPRMRNWSWYVRICNSPGIGYPRKSFLADMIKPNQIWENRDTDFLDLDEAEETDIAVRALSADERDVIVAYWCGHGRMRARIQSLGLSRNAFYRRLERAEINIIQYLSAKIAKTKQQGIAEREIPT